MPGIAAMLVLRLTLAASRLSHDLNLACDDGSYVRLLSRPARIDVLVTDDWGLAPLQNQERQDLREAYLSTTADALAPDPGTARPS